MEFIYYSICLGLGFYFGWVVCTKWTIYQAKRILAKAREHLADEQEYIKNNSLHLRMEKMEHMYFFYNKDDGAFVYSAPNKQELLDYINRKFPDKYIFLDTKDLKELEKA